jgi:flagellar biosynthesis/type III secretory pathway M-ring protein FliF/YscJ
VRGILFLCIFALLFVRTNIFTVFLNKKSYEKVFDDGCSNSRDGRIVHQLQQRQGSL